MDLNVPRRAEVLLSVIQEWREPEHPPRETAVHDLLHGENTFTAEATAFALNQLMASVTPEVLSAIAEEGAPDNREETRVLLEHGEEMPTSGVRELLILALLGVPTHSVVPTTTPALAPAIVHSLRSAFEESGEEWQTEVTMMPGAPVEEASETLPQANLPPGLDIEAFNFAVTETSGPIFDVVERRKKSGAQIHHIPRPSIRTVGVIDGSEPEEDRQDLAEDALIYEGAAPRCLKILWAPRDLTPDPILEAMAEFRGVFPAHDATPGALEMQRAFLEATDQSHAYAAGLQFLVSRGAPEAQDGAHVRWTEYDTLDDAVEWLVGQNQDMLYLVMRPSLHDRFSSLLDAKGANQDIEILSPGQVHRPPLTTPRVRTLLRGLRE